jgi:uncharacterized protein
VDAATFLGNLTSPPLLFFFLGVVATFVRSGAIGFKGGVALSVNSLDLYALKGLSVAVLLSMLVPVVAFFLLRKKIPLQDAAAIAATYGSVSAVTFVTCTSYLDSNGIEWSGYMVAAMALMEAPAIIVGLALYRLHQVTAENEAPTQSLSELLRESFLNSSVFLVTGSMLIGWVTGPAGMAQISPFVVDLFIGILCLFLLDMGIVAARRLPSLFSGIDRTEMSGRYSLLAFAIAFPLFNAAIALTLSYVLGLSEGDTLLLAVLAASASYIAVPAAMRLSLPEANPALYLSMSLAVTFPFNIIIGIPLYHALAGLIS